VPLTITSPFSHTPLFSQNSPSVSKSHLPLFSYSPILPISSSPFLPKQSLCPYVSKSLSPSVSVSPFLLFPYSPIPPFSSSPFLSLSSQGFSTPSAPNPFHIPSTRISLHRYLRLYGHWKDRYSVFCRSFVRCFQVASRACSCGR
jgi:hypothetical protein